jgi:hypothetical protein
MHEDDGGMHLDIDLRFDAENLSQVEQRVRERVLELQRMAEDFRSDASRQMLELREGRLFVRPADELNKRAEEIRRLYDRNAPEIQSRLEQRLAEMESRMEAAERSLEARMDRLAALDGLGMSTIGKQPKTTMCPATRLILRKGMLNALMPLVKVRLSQSTTKLPWIYYRRLAVRLGSRHETSDHRTRKHPATASRGAGEAGV